MVGLDHFLVYMQTAAKYWICIYTTPGALRAPGVVYIESPVFDSSLHIPKNWSTPAIFLFFLSPNPVVVYIFGVPKHGT